MAGEVVLIDPQTGNSYKAGGASGSQPSASSQSVTPASDGGAFPVQGDIAAATADAGRPVKIGGRAAMALPPVVGDGQRVNGWFGSRGQIMPGAYSATFTDGAISIAQVGTTVSNTDQIVGLAQVPFFTDGTGTTFYGRGNASGQFVVSKGGAGIATAQVAVSTAATLVAAARAGRQAVTITSTSAVVFYVGVTGVTTATGHYVAAAAGASITIPTAAAVYAVGASALTVTVLETF